MQVYMVTGANRGIGRGLVASLVQRDDTLVIAAVRNVDSNTTEEFEGLPKGSGSKIIAVQIDAAQTEDPKNAAAVLRRDHGIERIDTIIANAGISKGFGPAVSVKPQELYDHFQVNTIGPLALFQAFWPFLQQSPRPKFVAISTGLASITDMGNFPLPFLAYGLSKAALNYLVRKIHFEQENLIAFVLSPGWVQTDMGNTGAEAAGMKEAPVTLEQSVRGVLEKIDHATRSSTSGSFQSFDDTQYNW